MAIYIYGCTDCDNEIEVEHGMKESPEIVCDNCLIQMKKLILPVGISFKGSGFYINDSSKNCV